MERRVKYKMKAGLKIVGAFLFVGLLASCSSYKVLNIDVLHPGEPEYRKQECTNFVYRPEIGA